MTEVSLASLAMDIDVRSADPAEAKLRALTSSAKDLEGQFKRTSEASRNQAAAQGLTGTAAGQAEKSMRSLAQVYGQARDSLGRFAQMDGNYRLSQEATVLVTIQNAKAQAALIKEQERGAKQVEALTRAYDPLGAEILKTNRQIEEATRLQGAQSTVAEGLRGKLANLQKAHGAAGEAAKLQSYQLLNLGRQGADVFVSLASGQAIWMVAVQQGAQIGEIFAEAAAQGVGFKAALAGIAGEVGPMLAIVGPIVAIGGAIAIVTKAAIDGEKAVNDFSNAVALTGNAAGVTAEQYESMVSRVALSTQSGFGTARETILSLVSSGKVSGDAIETLALDIINLAEYTGKSTDEIAKRFTGMKGSVADFARELHDDYAGLISPAIIKNIADLEEQGKRADATRLLYSSLLGDLAEKGPAKVGVIEKAFRGFNDVLGLTLGLLSGIANKQAGAAAVGQINVAQLRNQISSDKAILNGPLGFLANRSSIQAQIDDNQRQLDALIGAGKPKPATGGGNTAGASAAGEDMLLALQGELDATKKVNAAQRIQIAGQLKVNEAMSKGISGDLLKQIRGAAEDVERAKIKREQDSAGRAATTAANRAIRADNRGDNAIEQAKAAELSAQLATTKSVEEIAGLKVKQIDQELNGQRVRLLGQAKAKEISDADAATAIASYERAAAAKKTAVDQQLAAELLQAELASRQASNTYLDQMAKFAADMATSAEERNAIELASLKRRQDEEAYALTASNALKVATGEISAMAAAEAELRQRNLSIAEEESATRRHAVEVVRRDLELRQSALQNIIDVAESERDLARSAGQRDEIESRILAARHEYEVASIRAAIEATTDADQKAALTKRLAAVNLVYANQVKAANSAERAFAEVEGALNEAARAFDDQDWARATAALFDAFDTFSKKLKTSGATLESKIGAIAGLAVGVGNAVGGTGGAALSGAGSGAMAGLGLSSSLATLGLAIPGPGWALAAVGGVLGGLGGLFGSSSAKKKARQQAAAQAAAAEAQRQQTIADTEFGLNVALIRAQAEALRAQGKEAEAAAKELQATNMERDKEIARLQAISQASVDMQKQLWALEEAETAAAEAAERAGKIEDMRAAIQGRIEDLTLTEAEKRQKAYEAEIAAAKALGDDSLVALIDKLYAAQDAASSAAKQQEAASAALQQAQAAESARTSAIEAANSALGASLNNLDKLTKSLNAFADSLGFGDMAANDITTQYNLAKQALASAQGDQIPGAAQAFLSIAKEVAGSNLQYGRDVAFAQSVARGGAQDAQAKIESLKSLGPLIQAMLSGNQAEVNRLQGLQGFATGGSFTVGGSGAPDSKLFNLALSPGEMVDVRKPGATNDNSLADLKAEFAAMREQLASIALSNDKMERTLTNVTEGGRAMQTQAAS